MKLLETLSAPSFEYKNEITNIDFTHEDNTVHCIWTEEGRVLLDFEYKISEKKFEDCSGVLGDIIEKSNLREEEKRQKILEILNIAMWRK